MDVGPGRQQSFPTTQWSLIVRAAAADSAEREAALAEICTRYWPPVYAFIRSRGQSPHDAEDLTQSFFEQLLRREDFAKMDAAHGRLRSYLLTAAKHFLASAQRRERTLKRGGAAVLRSLDVTEAEALCLIPEPADQVTPERIFERQWALTLMEAVVRELEARYTEKGQAALFAVLKPALLATEEYRPDAGVAEGLGLTVTALRVKLHRLRQRYAETLRKAVGATLGTEEDVEEEIRHLMTVFSG